MNGNWLWWCLWVCFCLSRPVDGATDPTDAQVMAEMAKTLKVDSSWTGDDPCSGWKGVSCSNNNKVTGINIQEMNLVGTQPADFNKLSALTLITMRRNLLSGPLPTFSGLSNLQSVFLESNAFDSIPADFFDGLTNLQTFAIDDNSLLAPWSIPAGVASATALTSFSANNATIWGEMPEFLGDGTIAGLQKVMLAYNYLTGSILTSFIGSSNLQGSSLPRQRFSPEMLPVGKHFLPGPGDVADCGWDHRLTCQRVEKITALKRRNPRETLAPK